MSQNATGNGGNQRSAGRGLVWIGIIVGLLGVVLCFVQFGMHFLGVPWYMPVLGTIGGGLLCVSIARRRTVTRFVLLGLMGTLAALEWYLLVSITKLPAYEGPAVAGQTIPAFQATLADGRPFTEKNLANGTPSILVFFRGRW